MIFWYDAPFNMKLHNGTMAVRCCCLLISVLFTYSQNLEFCSIIFVECDDGGPVAREIKSSMKLIWNCHDDLINSCTDDLFAVILFSAVLWAMVIWRRFCCNHLRRLSVIRWLCAWEISKKSKLQLKERMTITGAAEGYIKLSSKCLKNVSVLMEWLIWWTMIKVVNGFLS